MRDKEHIRNSVCMYVWGSWCRTPIMREGEREGEKEKKKEGARARKRAREREGKSFVCLDATL
jgi:hypothetical protein